MSTDSPDVLWTESLPPTAAPPSPPSAEGEARPVSSSTGTPSRGGGWTIPLLCAGIALIACCLLIPQSDENRRLLYEREKLKIDLAHVKEQIAVNDQFLHAIAEDPTLAERLAQRQLHRIREGTSVLRLNRLHPQDRSPFHLVNLDPPPQLPPYQPVGGRFAALCRNSKSQLYLMGIALMFMAIGLVCGSVSRCSLEPSASADDDDEPHEVNRRASADVPSGADESR